MEVLQSRLKEQAILLSRIAMSNVMAYATTRTPTSTEQAAKAHHASVRIVMSVMADVIQLAVAALTKDLALSTSEAAARTIHASSYELAPGAPP